MHVRSDGSVFTPCLFCLCRIWADAKQSERISREKEHADNLVERQRDRALETRKIAVKEKAASTAMMSARTSFVRELNAMPAGPLKDALQAQFLAEITAAAAGATE